jgi:NAD(P)H dehydrogenase (quinone)
MKVNIIFYSLDSHIYHLAEAVAQGVREVEEIEVDLFQVPEILSEEVLEKMGAMETKRKFAHIPIATIENLVEADAIIFGTPTRFGNMSAQMKAFLDKTGGLWLKGALIGKVGSVFTSSGTQHGGQESTILTFHIPLLHHGMIIVGVPYSEKALLTIDELCGGSPYGASTIAGPDNKRFPSENELTIARFQGRHVAQITRHLVLGARLK